MSDLPQVRVINDDGSYAPRSLPRNLVWRVCFGTGLATFGWLFAAVGMFFCLTFLPRTEFGGPNLDRTATATVTRIEETNSSENDSPIYKAHYTFVDDNGTVRTGASYTKDLGIEGESPVEYNSLDPDDLYLTIISQRRIYLPFVIKIQP